MNQQTETRIPMSELAKSEREVKRTTPQRDNKRDMPDQDNRFAKLEMPKYILSTLEITKSEFTNSDGSNSDGFNSVGSNSASAEVSNSETVRLQSFTKTYTSEVSNSERLCRHSFTEAAHSERLHQQSRIQTTNSKASRSELTNPEILGLQNLHSQVLIANVKSLAQKEKALTIQIIDYLSEISRRRAYLPKYTSLFTFLVEELGYCPSTAMLRINAIKAFAAVPEIRKKVLDNKMSLNAVSKTQSFINQQMREDQNKNKRVLTKEEQCELFAAIENTPASQIEDTLHEWKQELDAGKAKAMGEPPQPREVRVQKVTLEVDGELQKMVEELKSLLSHTHPGANLSILLKQVLPSALEKLKRDRGLVKVKRKATGLSSMESGKNWEVPSASIELATSTAAPSASMQLAASTAAPSASMQLVASTAVPSSPVKLSASTEVSSSLMKLGVRKSEEGLERTQKKAQAQAKKANEDTRKQLKTIKRGIPAPIKQLVWNRDHGCCQYRDPKSQKICGSRHQVQFDHIKPWSIGGQHSSKNLRLLCGIHNRHRSRSFGL